MKQLSHIKCYRSIQILFGATVCAHVCPYRFQFEAQRQGGSSNIFLFVRFLSASVIFMLASPSRSTNSNRVHVISNIRKTENENVRKIVAILNVGIKHVNVCLGWSLFVFLVVWILWWSAADVYSGWHFSIGLSSRSGVEDGWVSGISGHTQVA